MESTSERHAFLFDLDDTIYDHRNACLCGLAALRSRYSALRTSSVGELEVEYDTFLNRLHPLTLGGQLDPQTARRERVRLLFSSHGEDLSAGEAHRRASAYRAAYLASERAIPGAPAVIRALSQAGYPIGVVTNNAVRGQRRKLKVCRVDQFVRALVISQAVGVSKPNPEIFRIALRRLGAFPRQTVMVGDSFESDVRGAQAAGLSAIWFNRRCRPFPSKRRVTEIRAWEPMRSAVRTLIKTSTSALAEGSPARAWAVTET
jgi:HAD superfamily hydrolase (TIGR01549 family)